MAEKEQSLREAVFKAQLKAAKLEAINSQREELIGKIVEATIEKVEMEAHVTVMQERMELQEEIVATRKMQSTSKTCVEPIAIELERTRTENAELKAKVAELEAKISAISKRVANQPSKQVR